jgi:hypothetical protein
MWKEHCPFINLPDLMLGIFVFVLFFMQLQIIHTVSVENSIYLPVVFFLQHQLLSELEVKNNIPVPVTLNFVILQEI